MTESKPPGYTSRAMRADLEEADSFFKRITKSAGLSVLVTLGLLALFAALLVRQHFTELTSIIMNRVVVPQTQEKIPVNRPKPLPQRPQPIHHQIVPVKALTHQAVRPPRPVPHPPQPQGAHNHVLSTPGPGNGPKVLAGGNAQVGVPLDNQQEGNATTNPTGTPAPPGPTPAPTPLPVPTATPMPLPTATPLPAPTATPMPAPTATPMPAPTAVPGPSGPAAVETRVDPEIPDDLRGSQYTVRVRVRVTIAADGSATPTLRSSSGNPELDNLAISALRKWKWKPALRDGSPVESTQYFQFVFEVD